MPSRNSISFGQDAGGNAFLASLSGDTSSKMGVMHAIYGVGAMCAPLISTQFAQLRRWSFGYIVHVCLAITCAVFMAFAFRFKSQEGESSESQRSPSSRLPLRITTHVLGR